MTVKELKDMLNHIPDDCKVNFIHQFTNPNISWGFDIEKFNIEFGDTPYDISYSEKEVSIFLDKVNDTEKINQDIIFSEPKIMGEPRIVMGMGI